jgi:hypothetical protein
MMDKGTVRGILHRKAPPVGLCQLALRRPIMRQGAGKAPPGFGCGEGTLAVKLVVVDGKLAHVPANNRLPHKNPPAHHHPHPPRPSAPPHTCASVMSCRMLPARHAPARWACAPQRNIPGIPRLCRAHLPPLAQV